MQNLWTTPLVDLTNLLALHTAASTSDQAALPPADAPSALPDGASPPRRASPGRLAAAPIWSIYRVCERASSRAYIGVTKRRIEVRLAVHDHTARLRPHLGGPGSLAEAIRAAYARGASFAETFDVTVLEETDDPAQARASEAHWIETLGTMAPAGFNLRRGGHSLGGVCNARRVTLHHPRQGLVVTHASIMDAVAWVNRTRQASGAAPLELGTVYARLDLEWTEAEALELVPHADRRSQREHFIWNGVVYDSIAAVTASTGVPIATIRSRLQRARLAGCDDDIDLAVDRRALAAHPVRGIAFLPHPADPGAPLLCIADFARAAGMPAATVRHRLGQLRRAGRDVGSLRRQELIGWLTSTQDRAISLTLHVGGQRLMGGVRALVRRVLGDRRLRAQQVEQLGDSAIRARLRKLPGWPNQMTMPDLRAAFGFQRDEAVPPRSDHGRRA